MSVDNSDPLGRPRRSALAFVHARILSLFGVARLIRNVHVNLLFVGNALDARDLRLIYDNEIRAVIDLAINEPPAQLGRELVYCRFPINDGGGNQDAMIALALNTTLSTLRAGLRTLVACSAGMSRAPTIAAATLALLTNRDPDDCLAQIITDAPNDVSPILWTHIKQVYNDLSIVRSSNQNVDEQTHAPELRSVRC